MGDPPARGWLPISISSDWEPVLMARGTVRWMELGDRPLSEPFLEQTYDVLRAAMPVTREVDTSFEALERFAESVPPVQPAGFIFHISRCGSTLIANALKTAAGVAVFSEPHQFARLLWPGLQDGAGYGRTQWQSRQEALARAMGSLFAHYRGGTPERVVIKFPSISTLAIEEIRRIWPDVPCLLVIREPIEVIVASMIGGIWLDLKQDEAAARRLLGWDGAALSNEDFCARLLRQYFQKMMGAHDTGCAVVDYRSLSPATMVAIARFFDIAMPDDPAALTRVFGGYSKAAQPGLPFQNDSAAKQWRATPEVRLAAIRWAMKDYFALREMAAI